MAKDNCFYLGIEIYLIEPRKIAAFSNQSKLKQIS